MYQEEKNLDLPDGGAMMLTCVLDRVDCACYLRYAFAIATRRTLEDLELEVDRVALLVALTLVRSSPVEVGRQPD